MTMKPSPHEIEMERIKGMPYPELRLAVELLDGIRNASERCDQLGVPCKFEVWGMGSTGKVEVSVRAVPRLTA